MSNEEHLKSHEEEHKGSLKVRIFVTLKELVSLIVRSFNEMNDNNVTILASGLVYSTLIAIVPCASFLVAFLSLFGVLQPFITTMELLLAELLGAEFAEGVVETLSLYTNNAMGLGIFGLASFIVTAIFLVNKIYTVLNQIFRTQPRTGMIKRFITFFTFLVIGAIVIALMLSLQSTLDSLVNQNVHVSMVTSFFRGVLVFALELLLLFLLFKLVPNAKVRSSAALLGSLVGVIALYISTAVFKYVIEAFVNISVIYGSLASLFFLLLLLYVDWYIILVAAELTYVYQFRPARVVSTGAGESPASQISDSVNMLMLIGDSYRKGEGPISLKKLTRAMMISPQVLFSYLDLFQKEEIILEVVQKNNSSYVPARPLDQIYIKDVVRAIYGYQESEDMTAGDAVAEQIASTGLESFADLTIENLLERI